MSMGARPSAPVSGRSPALFFALLQPPMLPCIRAAFSLVELLIVMAISGVLFVALATFSRSSFMALQTVQESSNSEQVARIALARIAREIAMARTIISTEESEVTFTATDLTGDGLDDTVMYAWDPDTRCLSRTVNDSSEVFAENVTSFVLDYTYETETVTVIAAAGTATPVTLGQYLTPSGGKDATVNITSGAVARQTFINVPDVPTATSVSLRVKTTTIPCPNDMVVVLTNSGGVELARGRLAKSLLSGTARDLTVPLTWTAPEGTTMVSGQSYVLYIASANPPGYAGTIFYRKDTTPPAGYSFGTTLPLSTTASAYFKVTGELASPATRLQTVSQQVLKSVTCTIEIIESGRTVAFSRTCRILNQ